jgi:CCR4-NOT transcription complex subunit 4
MSARFASPVVSSAIPANPNDTYPTTPSTLGFNHAAPGIAVGPPPGLGFPPGLPINHTGNSNGIELQVDASRLNPPPLNSECLSFV